MPIKVPGYRAKGSGKGPRKRSAVAVLQVTAMVDMFTVLAVFLLQNYNTTGQVIQLNDEVELPKAQAVKELMPSNVVVISEKDIKLNNEVVADYQAIKEQEDWNIKELDELVRQSIEDGEAEKKSLTNQIKQAVNQSAEGLENEIDSFRKMTIQADKEVNFAAVKKVMYTVTAAGIYEINFAVLKNENKDSDLIDAE